MPRDTARFDIFVSSPSDIIDERVALQEIVDELNHVYSSDSEISISLNLLQYETNVYSDVGSHAQGVVTDQIGAYDIFIGILWTRFGTTTPNAMSGTEEEFNIAMERYENGEVMNVAFYFSDIEINPSHIDFKEYEDVLKFRAKNFNPFSKNLCTDYSSIEQFKTKVSRQLQKIIFNHLMNSKSENENK